MTAHPATRSDDLRKKSVRTTDAKKKLARDRTETIKRLHTMPTYNIMNALRANGLYSHRTNDQQIIRHVIKILRAAGIPVK